MQPGDDARVARLLGRGPEDDRVLARPDEDRARAVVLMLDTRLALIHRPVVVFRPVVNEE
jgi:hypothetical protein